jgi:hypothetical protein
MNEKYLWELWAKCKHPHPEFGGGDMVWPIEFAELIVRECIEICDNTTGTSYLNGWYAGKQIRKHFGVEDE